MKNDDDVEILRFQSNPAFPHYFFQAPFIYLSQQKFSRERTLNIFYKKTYIQGDWVYDEMVAVNLKSGQVVFLKNEELNKEKISFPFPGSQALNLDFIRKNYKRFPEFETGLGSLGLFLLPSFIFYFLLFYFPLAISHFIFRRFLSKFVLLKKAKLIFFLLFRSLRWVLFSFVPFYFISFFYSIFFASVRFSNSYLIFIDDWLFQNGQGFLIFISYFFFHPFFRKILGKRFFFLPILIFFLMGALSIYSHWPDDFRNLSSFLDYCNSFTDFKLDPPYSINGESFLGDQYSKYFRGRKISITFSMPKDGAKNDVTCWIYKYNTELSAKKSFENDEEIFWVPRNSRYYERNFQTKSWVFRIDWFGQNSSEVVKILRERFEIFAEKKF